MHYRCEAASIAGFIQQLAVSYVRHGYWFYVAGRVPAHKDPWAVDAKLIDRYDIDISKWSRARRKRAGQANLQYLRHERFFVLLATHGQHRFFENESNVIRDIRRVPLKYGGYAVSFRNGHASVRIDRETYRELKAYYVERAAHRPPNVLAGELTRLPFEPYAPVRRQLLNLLRHVNDVRQRAGLETLPTTCLRFKRKVYQPFQYTQKLRDGTHAVFTHAAHESSI